MARLFTCGLEENEAATGITMWSIIGGAGLTIAQTTPSPAGGLYRAVTTGSANSYLQRTITAPTGALYSRFKFQVITSLPSATTHIWRELNSSNVSANHIQINTSGNLILTNDVPVSPTSATSSLALSVDAWYRIEHKVKISDTAGFNIVRIYNNSGTLLETILLGTADEITGTEDTLAVNFNQFRVGKTASTTQFAFDDIGVNDESGSFQTSWLGPGKIALVAANNSTSTAWTIGGSAPAGSNWDGVNDVPGTPDDGVTYNHTTGTAQDDRLTVPTLPAEIPSNATMLLLDLYGRVSSVDAVTGTMALKIWDDGGTPTEGPSMTVNSATWRILTTAEHQVFNLAGKTKAQVENFSIGYRSLTGSGDKAITALWANVEWIESAEIVRHITATRVPNLLM